MISEARQRIESLVDPGSFQEIEPDARTPHTLFGLKERAQPGDGVVAGFAKIAGRRVGVFSQDRAFLGGSVGEVHGRKICQVMDRAAVDLFPVVGLISCGGARIHEGVASLHAYGEIFRRNAYLSGRVPQVSVIVGPSAGGAVYSPAMTDFVLMVKGSSQMAITGPAVAKAVLGAAPDLEQMGGAGLHASVTGAAHFSAPDEKSALEMFRRLWEFIPDSFRDAPRKLHRSDPPDRREIWLREIAARPVMEPYDIHEVIRRVLDEGRFLEVHREFSPNIVVGFGSLDSVQVGVVANQPAKLSGALDVDGSCKAARFVRFCDAYSIPILTLVDVPGYLPGEQQERAGIIRHGSKLLFAYCESQTPKITLILKKAYGGAYVVLGSRSVGASVCLAWPTAQIAVMGAAGAAEILFRKEIAAAANPDAVRRRLAEEYARRFLTPQPALERGLLDEVVDPADTRPALIRHLRRLLGDFRTPESPRHTNIPL